MPITLDQNLRGRILDVGGGGEGVIGRRWGRQVTAMAKAAGLTPEAAEISGRTFYLRFHK